MELKLITSIYIGCHFGSHLGTMVAILDFSKYPIRWLKATGTLQEQVGGAHSASNFDLTSQGARRAPIWWPKATSPPQELEVWPP